MGSVINFSKIANFLNGMSCPVHNTDTKFDARVENGELVYNEPCCSKFHEQIELAIKREMDIQIQLSFKNIFKKK